MSPAGQPLGTFLDRFLAHLIDAVIATLATVVLVMPFMIVAVIAIMPALPNPSAPPTDPQYAPLPAGDFFTYMLQLLLVQAGFLLLVLGLYYLYYVEFMFRTGQTVGKKVLKLRVVPLDPGAALTRGIAARRYLVQSVAGTLLPGFFYVDGLWQLWDKPYQQCLHDKFAKTVVVKVPR